MAAELEYRNGVANMFYSNVTGTPWHGEGVVIQGDEHYDFDGLMKKHFEYPLEKLPFFQPEDPTAPPDKQIYVKGDGAFYVWRPDTKKNLGAVGGAYEIVTNSDAFAVLKPLIEQRVASIETGGVLREGADAWLLVRWNLEKFGQDAQDVFMKDGGIMPYATVMANHSGRRGVMLGHTAIRIVCANTLGMAENQAAGKEAKRWTTISHKNGAKNKLVEAAQQLFAGVVQKFEVIAKQYRLLMATKLSAERFDDLVLDPIAPDPRNLKKFNPEAALAELVVERAMNKRKEIRRLWTEGKGHTGEMNAWFAYNAASEALDHNKQLWPNRKGSWRTASLMEGDLGRMKNAVLDGLVEHALAV